MKHFINIFISIISLVAELGDRVFLQLINKFLYSHTTSLCQAVFWIIVIFTDFNPQFNNLLATIILTNIQLLILALAFFGLQTSEHYRISYNINVGIFIYIIYKNIKYLSLIIFNPENIFNLYLVDYLFLFCCLFLPLIKHLLSNLSDNIEK